MFKTTYSQDMIWFLVGFTLLFNISWVFGPLTVLAHIVLIEAKEPGAWMK